MNNKFPKALIPVIIIGIVFLIILFKATVTIGSGEGGVLYRTLDGGVVTDEPPMGEGFHFVAPWNSVFVYEVRQQSLEEKMQVLSSNGLEIKLDASTWFQPKYDDLGKLHKEKGEKKGEEEVNIYLKYFSIKHLSFLILKFIQEFKTGIQRRNTRHIFWLRIHL